jgi:hypothetical protein
MTARWKPVTTYAAGTEVVRATDPAAPTTPIANPGFESGDVSWTKGTGWTIGTNPSYVGVKSAKYVGPGVADLTSNTEVPVLPGQSIDAVCWVRLGTGVGAGRVVINWYDAAHVLISQVLGTFISGQSNNWKKSEIINAIAPATAAYAKIAAKGSKSTAGAIYFDDFSWNYTNITAYPTLVYRGTAGTSGATEPVWPTVVAGTVVDGTVTWTAYAANIVIWAMRPIMQTGAIEPTWPLITGDAVLDGTVSWVASTRAVHDDNCPQQSKIAVAATSKIYAGDGDIIPFSATINPLDWSSEKNAGYLASGLQQYGSNPVAALGTYRSNLVTFNAEGFQMWQIDEDPANNSLLDAMPIGSTRHKALCAVANDLFFLSSEGVRTVGIAAASTNLQAGDVGMPIDPLVKPAIQAADNGGDEVFSLYVPAMGQFWLCIPNQGAGTLVFVYSMNRSAGLGWWSRYEFPFVITDWMLHGTKLHLRHGDTVSVLDAETVGDETAPGVMTPAPGRVWWSYLEFGSPGHDKEMAGFDIIGTGNPAVSVGYNQTNFDAIDLQPDFTPAYEVPPDTLAGPNIIPLSLTAPSFSVKVEYDGTVAWKLLAFTFYLQDRR